MYENNHVTITDFRAALCGGNRGKRRLLMDGFSKKVYLSLKMPTEEVAVSDHRRIELALNTLGYEPVRFPAKILRKLYPLCRDAGFDITVTLVHREYDWVLTDVEPGDTTAQHYGLAVDYGSTTIVMQLVDMASGTVVGEETLVNGQVKYGTDILTRITYALEGGSRPQDAPLSQDKNMDTPHLELVKKHLNTTPEGAAKYQEFFTLYHQMMLPVTMRNLLPTGMVGLFALFILAMMLSTDDSRLFSAAQTIVQDCVLPFCKAGVSPERHVMLVKITVIGCGIFWFIGSFFMSQLDYVNMFVTIMCSLWIGAGPMMLFGLYSRFGNTTGAFSSLISGMVLALSFIFLQRYWASLIYPALDANGMLPAVTAFFEGCSAPFEPWIIWRVTPHKFPINSIEINFIIMIFCLLAYIIGSLVTFKQPFNLDRMLHRGIYNTDGENKEQFKWSFRTVINKLIGITPEFTKGDKAITWSIFIYTIIFRFLIAFVLVAVLNIFWPWKPEWWGTYFYILYLAVPLVISAITMVWFVIGGVTDMKQLFKDLNNRVVNPLDNGQVEGNVNLADTAAFAEAEKQKSDSNNQN